MNKEFDPTVLPAYALGDLPPDQAAIVEAAALADSDLARRLEFLKQLIGGGSPGPKRLPVGWSRRSLLRRAAVITGLATASGGAAYAGYKLLATKPIIEDDFDDGWLDVRIWDTHLGRPRVKEENGYLRLTNRGSLATRRQFEEPISIQFDWMWIDRSEDPLYPDILKVAVRTAGGHHPARSFEILDGVVLRFDPHSGRVHFAVHSGNKNEPMPDPTTFAASDVGERMPLASGVWHTVRITDDGKRIAVFVSGGKITGRKSEPVVEVETDLAGAGRHISIFNRELVAGVEHESRIDNFSVRRLE